MKILKLLFNLGRWKPEKYKWYAFYDRGLSNREYNLKLEGDRVKIKPFAYLRGKKYRAKFFITKNFCKIIAGKHKLIVPLGRCSFKKKESEYFQGQSKVNEYYVAVVVKDISKKDYDRYLLKNLNQIKNP